VIGSKFSNIVLATLAVFSTNQYLRGFEATTGELTGLRATGILPAVVTDDGVVHSFIVPPEWVGNFDNLDLLQKYCERHNQSIHSRFLGPVITQSRLKEFREALPKARIEHHPAVSLGVSWEVTYHGRLQGDRLIVDSVTPRSPAAKAGVEKGDIILGIGEYRWPELDSQDSFQYAIRKQVSGQRTTVTVKRNSELVTLPIEW
jgi:C-terminal processing protease CtpA/Prc